jgi:hypothetical protein
MAVYPNGIGEGLKNLCWKQRVGSNPTTATKLIKGSSNEQKRTT